MATSAPAPSEPNFSKARYNSPLLLQGAGVGAAADALEQLTARKPYLRCRKNWKDDPRPTNLEKHKLRAAQRTNFSFKNDTLSHIMNTQPSSQSFT